MSTLFKNFSAKPYPPAKPHPPTKLPSRRKVLIGGALILVVVAYLTMGTMAAKDKADRILSQKITEAFQQQQYAKAKQLLPLLFWRKNDLSISYAKALADYNLGQKDSALQILNQALSKPADKNIGPEEFEHYRTVLRDSYSLRGTMYASMYEDIKNSYAAAADLEAADQLDSSFSPERAERLFLIGNTYVDIFEIKGDVQLLTKAEGAFQKAAQMFKEQGNLKQLIICKKRINDIGQTFAANQHFWPQNQKQLLYPLEETNLNL